MNAVNTYRFFDRLFLRAPFYSAEDYAPGNMPAVLERAEFREALRLASPGFYHLLEKQEFCFEKLGKKERFTLYKYFNRMSFRATPFGAFSSFGLASWTSVDQLRLVEPARAFLHLLPSLEWQHHEMQLSRAGGADFAVRPNPTIRRVGNNLRFIQSVTGENGKISFLVNEIAAEKLPLRLLGLCRNAPASSIAMIADIADRTGCSPIEAAGYFDFLVTEQLFLVSLDGGLIEIAPQPAAPGTKVPPEFAGNPWYAGLERAVQQGGIGLDRQEDLLALTAALSKLVIPFHTPALKDFTAAFKKKFDRRKVMLLDAVDPDKGVDYGNLHTGAGTGTLLKNIDFPRSRQKAPMEWTAVHRLFFRLWQNNAARGRFDALRITEGDLAGLAETGSSFRLPPSLAILFTRADGKLVLENNGGASATALIGRFSLFSAETASLCRAIAREESVANPEVLFAELHQFSDTHVDNINRRRPVYDYVIHINTYPRETGQQPLALSDLVLSVSGEELVLESLSLGKRIVPRLPTAYNFHNNELSLFRLLGDLQFQGLQANLTLDLEKLFPGLPFYPRVEYRATILCLAKWRLDEADTLGLVSGITSIGRLHLLRQERGIPRRVSLGQSDQQLVFDLADDTEALFFLDCLREKPGALIREYLPPDGAVTAGKAAMNAQFISLMYNTSAVYRGIPPAEKMPAKIVRAFLPGSSWIYLKVYCTTESADALLMRLIGPLIDRHRLQVMSWFFIRYEDPDPHIRLRILVSDDHYGKLLRILRDGLTRKVHMDLVRGVQQDTYEREIERYSPELMEMVEDHFYMGSRLALAQIGGPEMAVFALVYHMAGAFLDQGETVALFFRWRAAAFLQEFGGEKKLKVAFDDKYRVLSRELAAAIAVTGSALQMGFLESLHVLREQSADWPREKSWSLAADLIHMQVNRMFPVMQRRYEALICHCLSKYAGSALARKTGS